MYWMSHHLSSPSANQHRAFPFVISLFESDSWSGEVPKHFYFDDFERMRHFWRKIDDLENFKKTEDRLEGQTYFLSSQNAEKCRKMTERVKIVVQRKLNCDFIKISIRKNSPSIRTIVIFDRVWKYFVRCYPDIRVWVFQIFGAIFKSMGVISLWRKRTVCQTDRSKIILLTNQRCLFKMAPSFEWC